MSQGDAAAEILLEAGRPLQASDILQALPAKGVLVGGDKPAINFTSSLSRDERFYSFRRDGVHVWWLSGQSLPEEAPDLLSEAEPGAS